MLSRSITPLHATALVVGIIIGASIFVQPSVITGTVPTVEGVYSVWIASGILTLFGALIAAELASAYPHAGGVYVFLREAFSPVVGFLWGWAMFWTMHTGIIAVIAMVFARYVAFFLPVGDTRHAVACSRRRRCAHGGELRRRASGKSRPDDADDREGRRRPRDHRVGVRLGPRSTLRAAAAAAAPHRPRPSHSRSLISCSRSSRACSRSAAGTW